VAGGVTEEDSNPRTIAPLIVGVMGLQIVVEDVDGRAERMKVVKVGFNLGAREFG
jgi:hypothetical protein